jgi:VIT1/CCC1 family predicted Fe2+/Mn2+ transporter
MTNLRKNSEIVRSFTFGVEDSLVSTVGLLAGIAAADTARSAILLTGFVLIFVEGFSMGVGSLLSENSVEEYQQHREVPLSGAVGAAGVMFISYVISGLIPLLPYVWLQPARALWLSVVLSLLALFLLGVFNGRLFRIRTIRSGLEMLLMGGIAVLVGVAVGKIVEKL